LTHIRNNLIHNLDSYLHINDSKIYELYCKISSLDEIDLKSFIFGSGKEIETQKQQEQELDKEQEKDMEIIINDIAIKKLEYYKIDEILIIQHLNCKCCDTFNCIKFFNNDEILINNKQIYISYNLLNIENPSIQFEYDSVNFNDRICFVEFNDKILIELETICMKYYLNKLPVYSHKGNLLAPHMYNQNNTTNPLILDIDERFIKILGIKNYINPNQKSIIHTIQEIKLAIDNIHPIAFILLSYLITFVNYKFRYNPSDELIKKINDYEFISYQYLNIELPLIHNEYIKNDITYIYFYKNENLLKLNEEGYDIVPTKLSNILITNSFYLIPNFEEMPERFRSKFFKLKLSSKYKYLKYKEKYIKLKKQLNYY